MPVFYDTHAHLDDADFAPDFPDVLARAEAAGIRRIITIGTDEASSGRAIELAARHPQIFAAVGWHPGHVLEAPADFRPTLRQLAQHPKVVALGETGLDYYRLPSTHHGGNARDDQNYKQRQIHLFQQHLEVAAELNLNCVIHQRSSFEDTLAVLKPFSNRVRGVFHCFSENTQALHRILDINSLVSFTGILTFKNGQNVRDALAAAPDGSFMLETDSPYLAPIPYRGKRCEPAYVREIASAAAEVRHCSAEAISESTCATAHTFFKNLSPAA